MTDDFELVPKKTLHKMSELYDRIEGLEYALRSIAEVPIGAEIPDRITIWGLAVHMQETAKYALKGDLEKGDQGENNLSRLDFRRNYESTKDI